MVIKYVAYTWQGQRVEGVLDVNTEEDAYELLRRDEFIPYRLWQVRPSRLRSRSLVQLAPSLFQPPPQEIIEFTRGMAVLLRSGIPLWDVLRVLRSQSRSLGMKEALRQIIQDIESGGRLSEACARHPTVFPVFYVRLLKVGEATGGTALTMQHLAETLAKRKAIRDKVRAALVYPAISIVVALVAGFILMTFSLPALVKLLDEYGGTLPFTTKLLISIANFFKAYQFQIIGTFIGAPIVVWLIMRTPSGSRVRDRVLLRTPVVGGVLMRSNLFSLTSTFSTLLGAGVPPVESLRLSKESLNNVVLQEGLEKVTIETSSGTRLGQAFRNQRLFPPFLSQGFVTGEVAGTLAQTLRDLADYYEQETTKAVSGVVELIQPVLILVVGGVVGFVATAIISGIYSTIGSVQ